MYVESFALAPQIKKGIREKKKKGENKRRKTHTSHNQHYGAFHIGFDFIEEILMGSQST